MGKTHWKVEYVCTAGGKNHFCFDRVCMSRGKAATKPTGPAFGGSEPATKWEWIK